MRGGSRPDDTELARADTIPLWLAALLICGLTLTFALTLACADEPRASMIRPNVLVFLVDAARADHVGAYGYARDTTPNMDAFAASAVRYKNAISEGSFTFASVSSLFSGLPPDRTGLLHARRLSEEVTLLPEAARAAGYRTRGYSENPFITSAFGFDRGFDVFQATLSHEGFRRGPKDFEHSDPAPAIDEMLAFMSEPSEAPFFGYVHVLRPHNPYAPPGPFDGSFGSRPPAADGSTRRLFALDKARRAVPQRQLANITALYDENLAAADAVFGALYDGMRARGTLEETVVIVLSDHGEGFLEHGRLLHGSTVYDEMIRVPLIVRVPRGATADVERPVQLAELGRAIRAVFDGEEGAVERLTHLGREAGSPTFSWSMRADRRLAARTDARKVIVDTESLEAVAHYDLDRDPRETTPLPMDAEAERLLALARARVERGHASLRGGGKAVLDPALRQRLEALGYGGDHDPSKGSTDE